MDSNSNIKDILHIVVDCIWDDSNSIEEIERLQKILDKLNKLVTV